MSTAIVGNIVVGKRDVKLTAPSHVSGVHQGNAPKKLALTTGIRRGETESVAMPTRSTGISPDDKWPILPEMPKLTPP